MRVVISRAPFFHLCEVPREVVAEALPDATRADFAAIPLTERIDARVGPRDLFDKRHSNLDGIEEHVGDRRIRSLQAHRHVVCSSFSANTEGCRFRITLRLRFREEVGSHSVDKSIDLVSQCSVPISPSRCGISNRRGDHADKQRRKGTERGSRESGEGRIHARTLSVGWLSELDSNEGEPYA